MPAIDLSDTYTSRQMLLLQYQGKSNIIWYVVNKPLSTHTHCDFRVRRCAHHDNICQFLAFINLYIDNLSKCNSLTMVDIVQHPVAAGRTPTI